MEVCGGKFNAVSFFLKAEAKLACNLEAVGGKVFRSLCGRGSDGHGSHARGFHTEVWATNV